MHPCLLPFLTRQGTCLAPARKALLAKPLPTEEQKTGIVGRENTIFRRLVILADLSYTKRCHAEEN